MTLDDLERPIRNFAEKMRFTEPTRKKLNENRPMLSAAKCRSMILVSRNIRYMRMFAVGGAKRQRGCRRQHFLATGISVATSSETLDRRPALSVVCRQRPTRKPCCSRGTARCRFKIQYVSKFTSASRGSACDSTTFLSLLRHLLSCFYILYPINCTGCKYF